MGPNVSLHPQMYRIITSKNICEVAKEEIEFFKVCLNIVIFLKLMV
jgi:hypothetical protein